MKKPVSVFVSIALITMLSLTACGGMAPSTTGTIPNSLQAIEEGAEDIIDFVPSGNWDNVSADVTDMVDAWQAYEAKAVTDGISQELQDDMTAALEQLQ